MHLLYLAPNHLLSLNSVVVFLYVLPAFFILRKRDMCTTLQLGGGGTISLYQGENMFEGILIPLKKHP